MATETDRSTKTCSACGETKNRTDFQDISTRDGKKARCRSCVLAYQREWTKKNPEKVRASKKRWELSHPEQHKRIERNCSLKKMYGLTTSDYENMLVRQGSACGLCGSSHPGGKGAFQVDHDHRCCPGRKACSQCIRLLLCWSCNSALGKLNDDPTLLRKAADYIDYFSAPFVGAMATAV